MPPDMDVPEMHGFYGCWGHPATKDQPQKSKLRFPIKTPKHPHQSWERNMFLKRPKKVEKFTRVLRVAAKLAARQSRNVPT